MKSLKKVTVALVLMLAGMIGCLADFNTDPVVPLEIILNGGRHAVVSYLGSQVSYVLVTIGGNSVANESQRYFSKEDLENLGYKNKGSFTQLFAATSGIQIDCEVVPVNNSYDVRVDLEYRDENGKVVLRGRAYADVRSVKGDDITAELHPWVWIPENILGEVGNYASAKWVSSSWGVESKGLDTYYDNNQTFVSIPTSVLDDGTLLVYAYEKGLGHLTGYSLSGGGIIEGKELFALLGKVGSSEVRLFSDSFEFNSVFGFYEDRNVIYGQPPLVELVITSAKRGSFVVAVQIWGTKKTLSPQRIVVKNILTGDEFELQNNGGDWRYNLPVGTYHLMMDFPGVLNWNLDPNPKG